MGISLAISAATHGPNTAAALVHLVLNDNTEAAIYLNDGSPRNELHDLLDAWLADGNEIAEPEA